MSTQVETHPALCDIVLALCQKHLPPDQTRSLRTVQMARWAEDAQALPFDSAVVRNNYGFETNPGLIKAFVLAGGRKMIPRIKVVCDTFDVAAQECPDNQTWDTEYAMTCLTGILNSFDWLTNRENYEAYDYVLETPSGLGRESKSIKALDMAIFKAIDFLLFYKKTHESQYCGLPDSAIKCCSAITYQLKYLLRIDSVCGENYRSQRIRKMLKKWQDSLLQANLTKRSNAPKKFQYAMAKAIATAFLPDIKAPTLVTFVLEQLELAEAEAAHVAANG
jgi:hypothetical protein